MIDEFQDTSTIQWKNFKVLLEKTMSRENAGNLIVGDVKQSIYRWRSGDWRLLNNIDKEFNKSAKKVSIETLDTNYRSDRNIIEFNNAFFTEAVKLEIEDLKDKCPE
ncbi:DNA helicase, UvrD/REP type, partial [human gut metagenome]